MILLKRWRGDYKKRVLQDLSTRIEDSEDLTKIEWSVSKKQNKERSFKKIEDQEHHFGHSFECDTNQKSRFVRIPFNRLS